MLAAGGALLLGAHATFGGRLDAAAAAIGFFAALALFEVAAPLARGIGELGRMVDAARRIDRQLATIAARAAVPAAAATPDAPLLAFVDVGYAVGERTLFDGVSLTVRAGESLALTGESGSGKTTLLNLARGLVCAKTGSVFVDGLPIASFSEQRTCANRRLSAAAHGARQRHDCG